MEYAKMKNNSTNTIIYLIRHRVSIISHGGSIKFLLLNWCNVNNNMKLEYKDKELNITSPCLLKLTFKNEELINLEQVI